MLPMSPRLGKMLLYGCLLGVGPSAVKLGAVMSCRDPFLMPTTEMQRMKVNKAKLELTGHSLSDQVVVLKVSTTVMLLLLLLYDMATTLLC